MINLDPGSLTLLQTILKKHAPQYAVWLFGSRATLQCKPYSDIDLALISSQPIPTIELALLEAALIESDLPYKVDLIDFASITPEFQKIILQNYTVVQAAYGDF